MRPVLTTDVEPARPQQLLQTRVPASSGFADHALIGGGARQFAAGTSNQPNTQGGPLSRHWAQFKLGRENSMDLRDQTARGGEPHHRSGEVLRSLRIEGMSCASCIGRVERAIKAVPGVIDGTVNLATESARISFVGLPDLAEVDKAIRQAGYSPATEMVQLGIGGATCASCVGRVERALKDVPGVLEATVNLATERASVRVLTDAVSADELVYAVHTAGYRAEALEAGRQAAAKGAAREREIAVLKLSVIVAVLLTVPIIVLDMGPYLFHGVRRMAARQPRADRLSTSCSSYWRRSCSLDLACSSIAMVGPRWCMARPT